MAWGKAKTTSQPSTIRQLLPLVIVLIFLAGLAFVGYQIYLSVAKIQAQASQQMSKKNVVLTKDGVRVGVKHVENEDYVDKTQSWVIKAWNLHDGNKNAPGGGDGASTGNKNNATKSSASKRR